MLIDLRKACAGSRLCWPIEDVSELESMQITDLPVKASTELQEIKTVMTYLRETATTSSPQDLLSISSIRNLQLPSPPQEVKVERSLPEVF